MSLRDGALVAPIAGVVAKRHVLPGEKLSMEQNVLTIVDLARLELAGSVGTHEVSLLAPGMPVQVQVEGVPQPVAGSIGRIAPAAEAGTRAIGVTIALPNPKETFRAGQYALARVQLRDDHAPDGAGHGDRADLRPGPRVADRKRRAGAPRRHHRAARRGAGPGRGARAA